MIRKSQLGVGIFVAAMLALPLLAAAHHSGVMFEEQKEVTLEGVVKEFQFTNPHSWLLVDVTGKDGSVTTWGFEAEGPTTLIRNGIRPADFRVGTKLTITGHPMKDGRPAALWVKAVRADGKDFYPSGRRPAGTAGQ
jgi:uncharacterized protein DUF6152